MTTYDAENRFGVRPKIRAVGESGDEDDQRGDDAADALAERVLTFRQTLLSAKQVMALPPPEPLVGDLVPAKSLAVLWGRWGSAKSFVALDWALCVAAGLPWQGQEVRQGRVLYVAAEGMEGLSQRLQAWSIAFGQEVPDAITFVPRRVDLRDPEAVNLVVALAEADGFALVVIDTLNRSMPGGEENSSRDMGAVIDAADAIRQTGAAVLLIHHGGKDGQVIRGHSSLEGGVDTMIEAKFDDESRVVQLINEKAKNTAKAPKVQVRLITVELDEGRTSCVLRAVSGPESEEAKQRTAYEKVRKAMSETFSMIPGTPNEVIAATEASKTAVYDALRFLVNEGLIENVATGRTIKRYQWIAADRTRP